MPLQKKITIIFILLLNSSWVNAQTATEKYAQLVSSGAFPRKMTDALQAQINTEYAEKNNYKTTPEQKQKLDTAIFRDVYTQNMLISGEVLYGDSVGVYVNKVAGELLKNDPELLKTIHFYIVRSSNVSIANLGNGFIFINTGLIAQLEDEAQLAFILAHEIAHVVKKHSTGVYLEKELEMDNRNQYSYIDMFRHIDLPFSKENEIQADEEAFEMMKKSAYSLKSINEGLDLYQYSYLPFDDQIFDRVFFENKDFKFSDTLVLKAISPIGSLEDKRDKTQDDIILHERRGLVSGFDLKDDGRKKFILPKTLFVNAREYARFALCSDYLASRDYVNAIYASYILLKKHPESSYLKSVVSKALYAITISKSTKFRNPVTEYINVPDVNQPQAFESYVDTKTDDKEGNSQPVYYLFDNIQSAELNVMSVSYAWKSYKETGNKALKPLIDSLFRELFIANNLKKSDFSLLTREELKTQDSLNTVAESKDEGKYATIKSLQMKNVNSSENKIKFAFVTLFKDKEFSETFDKNLNECKHRNSLPKIKVDLSTKKKSMPKVVIADPYFAYYPTKAETFKKDIEKAEFQRGKYISLLRAEMKKNKVDYQLIDDADSLQTNIDEYNSRSSLHTWIIEREKNGSNPDALVLSADNCSELAAKLGTPYIVVCGIKTIEDSKGQKTIHFFKVYNIISGELVQFNVRLDNFAASAQDMSMTIASCIKELSGNIAK